jgi:hypothetical protein
MEIISTNKNILFSCSVVEFQDLLHELSPHYSTTSTSTYYHTCDSATRQIENECDNYAEVVINILYCYLL